MTTGEPDGARTSSNNKVLAGRAKSFVKKQPDRWALLIGVDGYMHTRPLRYCGKDMLALQQQLVGVGFPPEQIVVLHDQAELKHQPFKVNIEDQLDLLLGEYDRERGRLISPGMVEPGDLVVVAFSGHGVHLDKASYLCPVEARLEKSEMLISLEHVYGHLAASRAGLKLMLVDACRNDPRPGGTRGIRSVDELQGFARALEDVPQGIVLLSSCAPNQRSWEDDDLQHGVFTHYLIQGLAGAAHSKGDGRVSLLSLFTYASKETKLHVARVHNEAQTPVLSAEEFHDFELGAIAVDAHDLLARARDAVDGLANDSREYQSNAYALLAEAWAHLGDVAQARETLSRSSIGETESYRVAVALARAGQPSEAKSTIDDLSNPDPAMLARSLALIAEAYFRQDNRLGANRLLGEAASAARRLDGLTRANALCDVAFVQARTGEVAAARSCLEEALDLARAAANFEVSSSGLSGAMSECKSVTLAKIALAQQAAHDTRFRAVFAEAVEAARAHADRRAQVDQLAHVALAHARAGEVATARELMNESLRNARADGSRFGITHVGACQLAAGFAGDAQRTVQLLHDDADRFDALLMVASHETRHAGVAESAFECHRIAERLDTPAVLRRGTSALAAAQATTGRLTGQARTTLEKALSHDRGQFESGYSRGLMHDFFCRDCRPPTREMLATVAYHGLADELVALAEASPYADVQTVIYVSAAIGVLARRGIEVGAEPIGPAEPGI